MSQQSMLICRRKVVVEFLLISKTTKDFAFILKVPLHLQALNFFKVDEATAFSVKAASRNPNDPSRKMNEGNNGSYESRENELIVEGKTGKVHACGKGACVCMCRFF